MYVLFTYGCPEAMTLQKYQGGSNVDLCRIYNVRCYSPGAMF